MSKNQISHSIVLEPISKKHIDKGWLKWIKNKSINKKLNSNTKGFNKKKLSDYVNNLKKDNSKMFACYDKHKKVYFGNIKLNNIDLIHKTCSYGRMIGEKEFKNRGYGKLMLFKICELAFEKIKLNKVFTYVFLDNKESIYSNKSFGMKIEGILKDHFIKDGKYKDVYIFSMLKKDFYKVKKKYK